MNTTPQLAILALLLAALAAHAQPTVQWDRTLGGSNLDFLTSLQQTTDGGYILGGRSASDAGFEKSQNSRGELDYWAVKLDAAGNKQWDRTLGGSRSDELNALQQTDDGGYILGGSSASDAGFEKSQNSRGADDYWVVKLDASGNKQWDRTLGDRESDFLTSLQQTTDGGYILGGRSASDAGFEKSQNSRG
ncbi:MAG: T9SS C-terminal target domain-containing protein, partial [Sphingobacteriia bacterium]